MDKQHLCNQRGVPRCKDTIKAQSQRWRDCPITIMPNQTTGLIVQPQSSPIKATAGMPPLKWAPKPLCDHLQAIFNPRMGDNQAQSTGFHLIVARIKIAIDHWASIVFWYQSQSTSWLDCPITITTQSTSWLDCPITIKPQSSQSQSKSTQSKSWFWSMFGANSIPK